MTLQEEIERAKTDFYAFVETLPKQVGATPEAVIAGWWTARLLSIATKTADALAPGSYLIRTPDAEYVIDQPSDYHTKRKEWFTN